MKNFLILIFLYSGLASAQDTLLSENVDKDLNAKDKGPNSPDWGSSAFMFNQYFTNKTLNFII